MTYNVIVIDQKVTGCSNGIIFTDSHMVRLPELLNDIVKVYIAHKYTDKKLLSVKTVYGENGEVSCFAVFEDVTFKYTDIGKIESCAGYPTKENQCTP